MFGRKPQKPRRGMLYSFTDEVRDALAAARQEAVRRGHDHVGPGHILLGALEQPGGAALLARFGAPAAGVRARLEQVYGVPPLSSTTAPARDPGQLPYVSKAKRVLELAMDEARTRNADHVDVGDLLAGVVREENSRGAGVLADLGITLDRLREAARAPEAAAAAHGLRIDDQSSLSIYEQLVGQVREGVAVGRLRPGERLPSVRALADELDIAPGTVARAYAELERLGVVVTGGARGTRIAEPPKAARSDAARPEALAGLLRPVVVAAFHLGATAADLRDALERAMSGILDGDDDHDDGSTAASA